MPERNGIKGRGIGERLSRFVRNEKPSQLLIAVTPGNKGFIEDPTHQGYITYEWPENEQPWATYYSASGGYENQVHIVVREALWQWKSANEGEPYIPRSYKLDHGIIFEKKWSKPIPKGGKRIKTFKTIPTPQGLRQKPVHIILEPTPFTVIPA